MAERLLASLLQQVIAERPAWDDAALDGALLEKFLADQDGEAFSALVARHGPMVLAVCRRVLDNVDDADDAFQATFLVLARRAGSIRQRTSLASWLYGVADHLARKLRTSRTRRQLLESQVVRADVSPPSDGDLRRVIEEELARLPEKYRTPLLLCYYEGRTNEETARQLRWRPGTVKSRLARGRELLRNRLTRRGLAVTLAALTALTEAAPAVARVSSALATATARTALLVAAGNSLSGATAPVALLVEGMMRTTMIQRITALSVLVLGFCLAGGGGWWLLHAQTQAPGDATPPQRDEPAAAKKAGAAPQVVGNGFPRRMFVVAPANYLYTQPVLFGRDDKSLNAVVGDFAALIRVPSDQLTILSDKATRPVPPIKGMIERNVERFLDSCRPWDRVVVVFIGQAIEKNGKSYLLPIEGDPDDVKTLIPLDWFYEQLRACRAQQKILVVDVCRFGPELREDLPRIPPLGEKMADALRHPPEGVEVLSACSAGQYSYQLARAGNEDVGLVDGGVMLSKLAEINSTGGLRGLIQKPEEPIPTEAVQRALHTRINRFAELFLKKEQQVFASGQAPKDTVPHEPRAAAAPRFALRMSDEWNEILATPAEVRRFLKIVREMPATKGGAAEDLPFEVLPPFPADRLEGFDDGGPATPLRTSVRDAIDALKTYAPVLPTHFNAPLTNQHVPAFLDDMVKMTKDIAVLQFKLASVREELLTDEIVAARDKEIKYWQAAYDFTLARLHARIAYLYEYQVKLGQMRREFPARDPLIHDGWRLVPSEKMDALTQKDAEQASTLLRKMSEAYPGTPWEMISKRERLILLGLEWRPTAK